MIDIQVQIDFQQKLILENANKANFENLSHAAASIRKFEQAEFQRSPDASPPGTPPATRRKQMPNAIAYDVNKRREDAVIGPRYSRAGDAGAAHEFGGRFRGQDYPERPFALPALEANLDRFAGQWAGSIGE